MFLNHTIKVVSFAVILAVLICSVPHLPGQAQNLEGTVKGVTTDQWGAVIPSVTVVFESAGLRHSVKSHEGTGEFELVLPAGEYLASAELAAFHPYQRKKLLVEAGKTKKLKVKLKSKYPPITE
ncbi:MAG: carboxypeptidase regulatory-like domain-containing protein [Acidobacteria bacterium]|nr:carboxypeptidase regulatory-like domain-containing protein [Acidobacteriota bacterium]